MKTNCILLILLLSFSFARAQDTEAKKIESTVMVSQNNEDVTLNVTASEIESTIKEDVTNEATIARSSDIKIYLNRLRNVDNIDLLFPKINKTVKA